MDEPKLNSLDKMAKALNTTYVSADTKKEISEVKNETKALVKETKEVEFKNKEYILKKFKNLIDKGTNTLNTLSDDIRVGSSGAQYMAMADLVKSMTLSIKEYFNVNKEIYEQELMIEQSQQAQEPNPDEEKKLLMTSTQLKEMMDLAKKEAELNKIDAEFIIDDEKL